MGAHHEDEVQTLYKIAGKLNNLNVCGGWYLVLSSTFKGLEKYHFKTEITQ